MEEKSSARFSEYLFAKMGGQDVSASQGPRKVTADTRKWMRENLLLLVTLSGVLFGIILGKQWKFIFILSHHGILTQQIGIFRKVIKKFSFRRYRIFFFFKKSYFAVFKKEERTLR